MGHYYNIREKQGPGHKYAKADFASFVENAEIATYNVVVVLDVCGCWCGFVVRIWV